MDCIKRWINLLDARLHPMRRDTVVRAAAVDLALSGCSRFSRLFLRHERSRRRDSRVDPGIFYSWNVSARDCCLALKECSADLASSEAVTPAPAAVNDAEQPKRKIPVTIVTGTAWHLAWQSSAIPYDTYYPRFLGKRQNHPSKLYPYWKTWKENCSHLERIWRK